MNATLIAPVIIGRGMAGQAILKSLAIVSQIEPDLGILPAQFVQRGTTLSSYIRDQVSNVLFVANPSGLHARTLMEGTEAGFAVIACEKPVCVRADEIPLLEEIKIPVTVFHGYRAMWGTRTIKKMIASDTLGSVFGFESRYWQSSSAQAILSGTPEMRTWKSDLSLNGPADALTDLGSHVVDICLYLMADTPSESRCWATYRNSLASHRDTHVNLLLAFPGGRHAFASISKTLHGATNQLEYTVIGTKGCATWRFMQPDEVEYASGNSTTVIRRQTKDESSGSFPFHGLGWLEGYVSIAHQTLRLAAGRESLAVPTLGESLAVMKVLLSAR